MSTKAIEQFLQAAYTDEKLAALLAHAQDGRLIYSSCCCFIGVATADHPLRSEMRYDEAPVHSPHYYAALDMPDAQAAESEFLLLGGSQYHIASKADPLRRERLIPLILAEMDRREALKIPADKGDNTRSLEECFVPELTGRF